MPRCVPFGTRCTTSLLTCDVNLQLWMGTHPSCPSTLVETKENLKEYLKAHPELLGDKVVKHFGEDLPFLFKVSVERLLGANGTRTDARLVAGPCDSQGAQYPGSSRQEAR